MEWRVYTGFFCNIFNETKYVDMSFLMIIFQLELSIGEIGGIRNSIVIYERFRDTHLQHS